MNEIIDRPTELYGELDLGEVPCKFDVNYDLAYDYDDGWVCDGATAELVHATLGGHIATRYVIADIIGEGFLRDIEKATGAALCDEWVPDQQEEAPRHAAE